MKTTAKQLTRAYVRDFRTSIDGNVADHLLATIDAVSNYEEYLTDEEIEDYENASPDRRDEVQQEVKDWIKDNFDFDINDFEY